ncbi:hypothetical protein BS50DRAFT_602293 [Corynespora cassiicola Philippines]|uniref:Uncharacterized protein n=1 Tax=Corynespora cassiicola Philippines TaxID=1448308 RepID=A0A2T2NH03_CORCC|nr:hypothetical protein BS50DRAFT_602293 [Corynespora cassiicola Philippines]
MEHLDTPSFRAHLPDPAFLVGREKETPISHTEKASAAIPVLRQLEESWNRQCQLIILGAVIENLYHLQDDSVDTGAILNAAKNVLTLLPTKYRKLLMHPDMNHDRKKDVFSLIECSLSPEGFEKTVSAMKINHFLGELVNAPGVFEHAFIQLLMFENPSYTEPFWWFLCGHHPCLSAFVWKAQIIISPTFTGAEPNIIDHGPRKGTQILHQEQNLGLRFMQSLPGNMQVSAQIFKTVQPPEIPEYRLNPADQRHLCGAFQDNRIILYKGVRVADLNQGLVGLLLQIVEHFIIHLPSKARQNRLAQVKRHFDETYFCWIGGYGENDPFYYKIHSIVIICEFYHNSGVFLENKDPERFHIHAIVRSPNGGDYGFALLDKEKDNYGKK